MTSVVIKFVVDVLRSTLLWPTILGDFIFDEFFYGDLYVVATFQVIQFVWIVCIILLIGKEIFR